MSWVKIDDKLTFHPKVVGAGNEAVGAWVRMLAYAGAHLTDGRIPSAIATSLAGGKPLASLMQSGLLEALEDGDFYLHDFLDWNPTRDEVRQRRGKDSTRHRLRRVPENLKALVIERDGPICGICRELVESADVHIDLRIPLAEGGTNDFANLQVTHTACTMNKGPRPRGRPHGVQLDSARSPDGRPSGQKQDTERSPSGRPIGQSADVRQDSEKTSSGRPRGVRASRASAPASRPVPSREDPSPPPPLLQDSKGERSETRVRAVQVFENSEDRDRAEELRAKALSDIERSKIEHPELWAAEAKR